MARILRPGPHIRRLTGHDSACYDERMERLAGLGMALAHLRSLLGLSIEACAARIGTPTAVLSAAEEGNIDPEAFPGIARLYGLDEEQLHEGMVMPVEGVESLTVFLLHGAYQDFDAHDLGVLDRAMRAARAVTALSAAASGGGALQRRLQFTPVPPAGPQARDAARQGYRLARWVREKLGLGGKPLSDVRALLEEDLGIVVVVDELVSSDLRAASILAEHRAAAAAVLAADDPERSANPTLTRVYLAHELAHLLFDPAAPGSVLLALDDRLRDRANRTDGERGAAGAGASHVALLESRAKGFAAELLIPLEGLTALFGSPTAPVSSLSSAKAMVSNVCAHFGTPVEIATYHLRNLGFIQPELVFELLRDKPGVSSTTTSLPAAGATPLLLQKLLAPRADSSPMDSVIQDLSRAAITVPAEPPWYVADARSAAAVAMEALTLHVIEEALRAVEEQRETEAADALVDHFDSLFLAGEFDVVGRALAHLNPERLPPRVLTGVLMVTAHARAQLGEARGAFFERVKSALAQTWQLSPAAIEAIERRLR